MTEITPQTLSNRLEADDDSLLVLDIRPPDSFEEWHIPGSLNVDVYEDLETDPQGAAAAMADLPSDREIVTVCGAGVRSQIATTLLRDRGYEAKTLVDGMEGWARVHRTATVQRDPIEIVQVTRPGTGCLSYVLIADGEAVLVDPSQYTEVYEEIVASRGLTVTAVLETHAHADHISGASSLAHAFDVPYYLHPADAGDRTDTVEIAAGDSLSVGSETVSVLHTPGHTPGSVTFEVGADAFLTGDTLFLDSVGRPDLGGDELAVVEQRAERLHESLQRILDRGSGHTILPAHDAGSPSPPVRAPLSSVRADNDLLSVSEADFIRTLTGDMPEEPANHDRIKRANVGEISLAESDARALELGPNQCAAN